MPLIQRLSKAGATFAVCLAPSLSYGAAGDFVGCWDQTFAYNLVNILQVSDGFEVTLNGSQLAGDDIQTIDGVRFNLGKNPGDFQWHTGLGIYVKFPAGSCHVDVGHQTASCRATLQEVDQGRRIFVTWEQSDISRRGQPVVPFSAPGDVTSIELKLSAAGGVFSYDYTNADSTTATGWIGVNPYLHEGGLTCGLTLDPQSESGLTRHFPDRLLQYLRRN